MKNLLPSNKWRMDNFAPIYGTRAFFTILALLAIFVYRDYLSLNKLFLFKDIGSDTLNTFYPLLVHMADYLRSDGIPLWSFNRGMGQGIFAALGAPFEWPLFAMGSDRLAYGIAYMEAIKVILGGTFFFCYLRLLSSNRYACAVGGLLYAFSGFMIVGSTWYIFSTMAVYLAFLLYAFERYLQHDDWWLFPPVIALIAASDVFNLYTHALFLAIYGSFRYCDLYGWKPRAMATFFLKTAGLGMLGMGIAATFLVANVQEILQSHRVDDVANSLGSMSHDQAVFSPASAGTYFVALMRAFSNNLTGAASNYHGTINYLEDPLFYCGLISLLLAPQAFAFLGRRQRILYGALALIFCLPVIFPYFRYAFWLFAGDYYRVLSLFIIIIELLFTLKALENIMASNRVNAGLLAGTLLLLLIGLFYPYKLSGAYAGMAINPKLQWVTAWFLCLYSLLIMGLSQKKLRIPASIILLAALCGELGMTASMTVNGRAVVTSAEFHERVGYNDDSIDMIDQIKQHDKGFYRIEKTYSSGPATLGSLNDGMAQGYWGTSAYQSFNENSYLDFMDTMGLISKTFKRAKMRWILGLRRKLALLAFASVKYLLIKDPKVVGEFTGLGFLVIGQAGDVFAVQNPYALPFGFTYDAYIPRTEFMLLDKHQKESALLKAAVLEPPLEAIAMQRYRELPVGEISDKTGIEQYASDIQARQSQAMKMESFNQNEIKGRITLNEERLLFFTIPFDSGWHAEVDGVPSELLRMNIGFTGLMVKPGSHTIALKYQPAYWDACWTVSGISLLVYLFYLLKTRKAAGRYENKFGAHPSN